MSEFPFVGERVVTDGSGAVVWVERLAVTGAAAYPITPSSNMGVGFQQAVASGAKNAWGESLAFFEPESEHSSASVCEGYALSGGRVTNFTCGQGLILMKEVLYVIAGKRLPVVFHIAARALTVQALNIHAGHDDVMGVADCGWGMLFARNAQEAADFALIARRTAEAAETPFFSVQDGFLTSHTTETVRLPSAEFIKHYLTPPSSLTNFMDPKKPIMSGVLQNQDAYMRSKVAQRVFYEPLKERLQSSFQAFHTLTGRQYSLIESSQIKGAKYAIVGMGSFMETAKIAAMRMRETTRDRVAVVAVLAFRPFPGPELVAALKGVKVISVLERLDDAGAQENPLARELKAAFADAMSGHSDYEKIKRVPVIQHGAGGVGGRDVRVRDFQAIVANMKLGVKGVMRYCVGISHPAALTWSGESIDCRPKNYFALRGHSVGGYGSITTNKVIAAVCAELLGVDVQAYPKFGAEKKGLPTLFFLAMAGERIQTHQELEHVNFISFNDASAVNSVVNFGGICEGGVVFLQSQLADPKKICAGFPKEVKQLIQSKQLSLYALDATAIAKSISRSPALVIRMQGIVLLGVFLRIASIVQARGMAEKQLFKGVESVIRKHFGHKGDQAVEDNMKCVQRGYREVIEVIGGKNEKA